MRGGFLVLAVSLAVLACLVPSGATQSPASVEPAIAAPGQTIHLVYTPGSPGPVDVGVQRTATCAITAPDGKSSDCSPDTTLVAAHVSPGTTSYAWEMPAPATLGNYTVTFQETNLLALPGSPPSAQAHFEVAPPGKPSGGSDALTPGSTNDPGNGTRSDSRNDSSTATERILLYPIENPLASVPPAEPSAPAKLVVSSAAGAGSLVLLLLAHRFGS